MSSAEEPPVRSGASDGVPGEPGAEPVPESNSGPGAEPVPESNPEPGAEPPPEPTGRARFRVLTGGRSASADSASEPSAGTGTVTADEDSDTESIDIDPPGPDFRVRCPDCGPQYVAIADVRFVSTGCGADTDRYLFTCPACGLRVRRPAGPELARILKSSGVATLALRRGTDQAL